MTTAVAPSSARSAPRTAVTVAEPRPTSASSSSRAVSCCSAPTTPVSTATSSARSPPRHRRDRQARPTRPPSLRQRPLTSRTSDAQRQGAQTRPRTVWSGASVVSGRPDRRCARLPGMTGTDGRLRPRSSSWDCSGIVVPGAPRHAAGRCSGSWSGHRGRHRRRRGPCSASPRPDPGVGTVVKYAVPGRRLKAARPDAAPWWSAGCFAVVGFFVIPVVGMLVGFPLGVYVAERVRVGGAGAWPSTRLRSRRSAVSILIELVAALARDRRSGSTGVVIS